MIFGRNLLILYSGHKRLNDNIKTWERFIEFKNSDWMRKYLLLISKSRFLSVMKCRCFSMVIPVIIFYNIILYTLSNLNSNFIPLLKNSRILNIQDFAFSYPGQFVSADKIFIDGIISNYIYTLGQKVDRDLLLRISRYFWLETSEENLSLVQIPAMIRWFKILKFKQLKDEKIFYFTKRPKQR